MLDDVAPYWYERVSVGALNLASATSCVLGQLFGYYHAGMVVVFGTLDSEATAEAKSDDYGFSAFYSREVGCPESTGRAAWDALTQAWREEITRRRMSATTRTIRPRFVAIDEVAVCA